ncbi:MAG: sodium-dependent bicarbonate transport family permease [Pseudomonadota bacterium]
MAGDHADPQSARHGFFDGFIVAQFKPYVWTEFHLAATYGSVSAATFVTSVQYLENQNIAYGGGHMAAAMLLMESPAISMAIIFVNALRRKGAPEIVALGSGVAALGSGVSKPSLSVGKILHESCTEEAQISLSLMQPRQPSSRCKSSVSKLLI